MEYIDIPIRCKVVWSLQEWTRRSDILVERKTPRKPMDIAHGEQQTLKAAMSETKRASWCWRNPA